MRNFLLILSAFFLWSGSLLAQGLSNSPKTNPDLKESKYNHFLQPKSFTNSKDLRLPLASKGLRNRSIENIDLYGKEHRDSLLTAQPQAKLKINKNFEPIVYSSDTPIKRIKDERYMPTVQPADSAVYHSMLKKWIYKAE